MLHSASHTESGIPQQLLDAKAAEVLARKQAEQAIQVCRQPFPAVPSFACCTRPQRPCFYQPGGAILPPLVRFINLLSCVPPVIALAGVAHS